MINEILSKSLYLLLFVCCIVFISNNTNLIQFSRCLLFAAIRTFFRDRNIINSCFVLCPKHNQFLFRALSFAVTTDYHNQNFLANIQYVKIFNVVKVCEWLVYVVCDRFIYDSKIIIFDNCFMIIIIFDKSSIYVVCIKHKDKFI